jgi:hypothetical protein
MGANFDWTEDAIYESGSDRATCEWHQRLDDNWQTSCGNTFVIYEGAPTENGMKYCPYCGASLQEIRMNETINNPPRTRIRCACG